MTTRKRSTKRVLRLRKKLKTQVPRNSEEYFARPERFQETWNRVTHVISKMRTEGSSLQRAAREAGIDSRKVVRLGKAALKKQPNGRYAAKKNDRLLRVLVVSTPNGLREVVTRDSREASIAGLHAAATQRYLQTGDDAALRKLPRKYILDSNGKRVRLLTKREDIERRGSAGELTFESIYARVA